MNLSIDIPDNIAAALKAKAQAQGVSADRFITDVLEKTLAPDLTQEPPRPLKTGRGLWAKYGPAPSAEDIDENRREMFRNFARD
jgi:hypothetical protein